MIDEPPFKITAKTNNLVAEISELVGRLQGSGQYQRNLHLRKVNRIRSIHSSTAIEGNTLTAEQVEDVINGKRVIGRPREIMEVKNAYNAYEQMLNLDPYSVDDFLTAHRLMTDGLVQESGVFRGKSVGVYSGGELIHAGANQAFVPQLVGSLFNWAKSSDVHPLIKSSVMHFEIEFIHPFIDGNGRTGRMWQTLVLSKWHEILAWVPIETIVYEHQQEYYDALHAAERQTESTVFIEFMLGAIKEALAGLPVSQLSDIVPQGYLLELTKETANFAREIIAYLVYSGEITAYKAQLLTGKSSKMVRQYLGNLVSANILVAEGKNKGRKYKLSEQVLR